MQTILTVSIFQLFTQVNERIMNFPSNIKFLPHTQSAPLLDAVGLAGSKICRSIVLVRMHLRSSGLVAPARMSESAGHARRLSQWKTRQTKRRVKMRRKEEVSTPPRGGEVVGPHAVGRLSLGGRILFGERSRAARAPAAARVRTCPVKSLRPRFSRLVGPEIAVCRCRPLPPRRGPA